MSQIGVVVSPERQTVAYSGKRIDIGHIVQIPDVDIQVRDEPFEGSRENANLILLVIVQLGIIITFTDLLRSLCQLLQGSCDPSCESHDENDKDDQQYGEGNGDPSVPFVPGCIDLPNRNCDIQSHSIT